jgi:predicted dehydrogenase
VVALAEVRPELAKKVAARHGVPRYYTDYGEMLAKESLDGIVASQPFAQPGVIIPDLATAGIPIFAEKPISSSLEMGKKIIAALEKNKTWLMVGYHKRSDPATIRAKHAIEELKSSGEIGKMRYVRISMPPGDYIANGFSDMLSSSEPVRNFEMDPPPSDMDAEMATSYEKFVNYYIHQVNLLRHLLGENYEVTYADPAGILFVAHSTSGIPCTIEMAAYQTPIEWHESALVGFDRGYVKLDLPAPLAYNRAGQVEIYKCPGQGKEDVVIKPVLPWMHAMRQQAVNFIKAIRGEAVAPCLAPEALDDLRIARNYIRLWKGN